VSAEYRELAPPPALANRVACFWFQRTGNAAHEQRVVPDACSDIVVFPGGRAMAVGPATRAVLVQVPARTHLVGVRFRPGMAPSGFGVPASELLDLDTPLDSVWTPSVVRSLEQRLADARSIPEELAALCDATQARLENAKPIDFLVERAVRWLAGNPSGHVHQFTAECTLSERQLLRRFRENVGYAPKALQRVLRLQRLLMLARRSRDEQRMGLPAMALAAGYLDQAHMTREVRTLTGETPSRLLATEYAFDAMSDFFKTVDAEAP
jgi:AraC-like DNA-binding protein